MLCILKAIIAFVIMLLIGTNLIGLIVRGFFWSPPVIDTQDRALQEVLAQESSRMSFVNKAMTFGSIIVAAAYFYALSHFWNSGLALAGAIIMASRLPDLMSEIRTGRKPVGWKEHPKGPIYFLASVFQWATLVLVWYSLCVWKSGSG